MEKDHAIDQGTKLIKNSKIAFLGSVDGKGFPNIKAMMNLKNEGMEKIWFSTNTSSKRVSVFRDNPKACVYYVDMDNFKGLMLVGTIEVCRDEESRRALWFDGSERYYPQGIDDPDYSVLVFTAERGNYYHGLSNIDFEIGD